MFDLEHTADYLAALLIILGRVEVELARERRRRRRARRRRRH